MISNWFQVNVNVTVDCDKIMSEAAEKFTFEDSNLGPDSAESILMAMAMLQTTHLSKSILECMTNRDQC